MRKAVISCICICILSACASVQQSDNQKSINQYLAQAEMYEEQGKLDFAEINYEHAIKLSKEIFGNESKEVADLYLELAVCNDTYDEALYNADIAKNIFLRQDNAEGLARTFFFYGAIYFNRNENLLSQQAYEDALRYCDLSIEDKSQLKFDIYLCLSGLESLSDEEALAYAQLAEKSLDKITEDQKIRLYISMGHSNYNLGMPEEAINCYEKALKSWGNLKGTTDMDEKKSEIADIYDLCGHCYISLGDSKKGIEYIKRSLEMLESIGDATLWNFASAYRHLSVAYTKEDTMNKEKALEYGIMSCEIYFKQNRELSSDELEQLKLLKDALRDLYEINLQIKDQDFDVWFDANINE